jgi:indolepyruvate decarboxylase
VLQIRRHRFDDVLMADFIQELIKRRPQAAERAIPHRREAREKFVLQPAAPITIARLFARLNEALNDDTIVIADVGDALFGASDLVIRQRTEFLSPAYYTSMGFAVPATLGASFARKGVRVIAIVGDGAFQMTGMELSTLVRYGFDPIIIVLDNKGYGTERFLHPGEFNDIQPWQYHLLPKVVGGGTGYEVRTEGEFEDALSKALADRSGLSLIQVHIGEEDVSIALERLADKLSKRV